MKTNFQILIIGFVWPEPNSSAAGLRMLQLIEIFLRQDWEVTFASAAMEGQYMSNLSSIGVEMQKIELNSDSFDLLLRKINPDVVLFDRFMIEEQFGWRVALNCPNALRILDTEDLHSLRIGRQNAYKQKRHFQIEDMLTEEIAKREIASILRSDITLVVSEFEMDILKSLFKVDNNLLYYLPIFAKGDDYSILKWKAFREKKDFMFIGNFLHEPNWNTVQFLKEEIWPSIRRKMPKAILQVYGAYPSQKVYQLHNEQEGFLVKGRAENSEEVFDNSRILLAPLRFGAGIKGKLIEVMQLGTPSVTTSIGAESISGDFNWNGFITDEIEVFAQKAVELYNDEELFNRARENGVAILKDRFREESFEMPLVQHILKTIEGLECHRKNNFLGALLQHHTLKSTEYMSRWIQEKNKN